MRREPRAYLWDVREAADAILEFTLGLRLDGYATVDHPTVWETLQSQVPTLRNCVAELLDAYGPAGA
ncbi:MAG TPA: hypothetical protein VF179_10275 [Thermoanaerobaculia bacterium]|nr:hypothetical protein [Thermoanaerobaculia bacterium]